MDKTTINKQVIRTQSNWDSYESEILCESLQMLYIVLQFFDPILKCFKPKIMRNISV